MTSFCLGGGGGREKDTPRQITNDLGFNLLLIGL